MSRDGVSEKTSQPALPLWAYTTAAHLAGNVMAHSGLGCTELKSFGEMLQHAIFVLVVGPHEKFHSLLLMWRGKWGFRWNLSHGDKLGLP